MITKLAKIYNIMTKTGKQVNFFFNFVVNLSLYKTEGYIA